METFPRNIEIKIREEADLRPVFADATQLHQVLLNLCVNARDAMPDGGSITIHASHRTVEADSNDSRAGLKPGDYLRLSVADTGTGIPEAIRERIFEPFFTTKEIGKGTGLGLSTVNTIVRNHEGRLEVESETGRGTTFHILLPVATGDISVPEAPPSAEELRGHGELILVVDDETAIRELAAAALKEFGYRVRTAQHGQEAIAVCESLPEPISLLVTDIMMPVMDGTRTIKALRTRHPGLPVIAMSGLLESSEVKRQQSLDHTEVLAKPFDPIQLTQAVHRLLNERRAVRLAA
jgi:CheY-like chemotaxis protein